MPALTPRPAPHWLRAISAALLFWMLLGPAAAQTTVLTQAEFVAADVAQFPADAAVVTLPDEWAVSRPEHGGVVWYRVRFEPSVAARSGELLAVFIAHVCSNVEAYVNGHLVHRRGSVAEPVSRNCYRPQWFTVPSGLLRADGNTIDLRVAGPALATVSSRQRAGALSAIEVGTAGDIAVRYAQHYLWRVALPQGAAAALVLLGGFIVLLGWRSPRERHLMFFGGLSVAWAVVSARLWLADIDWPTSQVEIAITSLFALVAMCAVQFLLRYSMWQHRVVDIALLVQCVVVPASLVATGPQRVYLVATGWYFVLAVQVVAAIAWYLWRAWRVRQSDFALMLALLVIAAILVGVELLAQRGHVPDAIDRLRPLAMPVLLAALGTRLLWQHMRAYQAAEVVQRTLESRVREATAEMERSFKLMAEMRVEQVTQQERKRIAGDLHDDLGAKLLTIVHTSSDERISTLAREALEEMRLSVRGLTGKPVRLSDALGDWRAEVVARLSQAGVEGDWRAPADEEVTHTLPARAYVQTTRILREAVSNIIKHSGASRCSVTAKVAEGDFQLVIQDNGRGIPMEMDGKLDRGHGMASMKHRAKQLHGQCLVESGPGYGTVIRLTLPLERSTATA